tara:strand:+ start:11910 stop:12782 length:873 start_codon:yes stop_codon:yes gene_type:complete
MLTILIMAFHSHHLIYNLVKSIDKNIPIVIVENSLDKDLKNKLEKNYPNVKVIIPNENLGFAKGANLGISVIKTEYVFINPSDVFLPKECINDLKECINNFDKFAVLAPTYKDESLYKNYELYSDKPPLNNIIAEKFGAKEVDIIDGTFIIKKSEFEKIGFFDENIFIYFEPWDLSKRITKSGKKIYVCDKIKFEHLGGQSHDPKYDFEATLSRNWHYCWSKFYYIKKYNNYLYALKKTLPTLFKAFIKCIKFKILNNTKDYEIHMAEVKGLISSYLLKKSSYRPYKSRK